MSGTTLRQNMIAIITYDCPHRKTQDLVTQLLVKGHKDLLILAIPFVERKNFQPLFIHRPSKAIPVSLDDMCRNLGLRLVRKEIADLHPYLLENKCEHVIIAGAGVLPEELAKNHRIINSHPGYLPFVKGLDALKWAIYHGHPIGATTHYISEKADEGLLIEKREVPVFFEDSFHSVAYRQYEMEIEMLANAVDVVKNLQTMEELADDRFEANRRMPHHLELKMMTIFRKLADNSPSFRKD